MNSLSFPSDTITLSIGSFQLIQPAKLETLVRNINEEMDNIRHLKQELSSNNDFIRGKAIMNNQDVIYNKGYELVKMIDDVFLRYDESEFNNIAVDVYVKASNIRNKMIDSLISQIRSKIAGLKEDDREDITAGNFYQNQIQRLERDLYLLKSLRLHDDNHMME